MAVAAALTMLLLAPSGTHRHGTAPASTVLSKFGRTSPLDCVPNEILDMIMQSLPDLPSLLYLLHASPHFNALFNAHPLQILRPILARLAPQTRDIIRLVCHLRCLPLSFAPAEESQSLDDFLDQHLIIDKPGSAARDDRPVECAPPVVLRAVVALDAKVDALADALLATCMRRCLALMPTDNAGSVEERSEDKSQPAPCRALSSGAPTNSERLRARQAFWRIQLFLDLHNAFAQGRLAWPDGEGWGHWISRGSAPAASTDEESAELEDEESRFHHALGLGGVEFWGLPGFVPENNVWVGERAGTAMQLDSAREFVELELAYSIPAICPSSYDSHGRPVPALATFDLARLPWPRNELLPFDWTAPCGWAHPDNSLALEYLGAFFWGPERLQALGLSGSSRLDPSFAKDPETEGEEAGEEHDCDNEGSHDTGEGLEP